MSKEKQPTQAERIHKVLLDARGEWVNGRIFIRDMWITQAHRAISDLEKNGIEIEHSTFRDDFGFVSYRIKTPGQRFGF